MGLYLISFLNDKKDDFDGDRNKAKSENSF